MKIVIINGSARKGNTLAAINAFIKGASVSRLLYARINIPESIHHVRFVATPPPSHTP